MVREMMCYKLQPGVVLTAIYSIEWVILLYMLYVYLRDKSHFIQYKYILHALHTGQMKLLCACIHYTINICYH